MIGHGGLLVDNGFWACLGDLPPDMPRRPGTWVALCNLTLKLSESTIKYIGLPKLHINLDIFKKKTTVA